MFLGFERALTPTRMRTKFFYTQGPFLIGRKAGAPVINIRMTHARTFISLPLPGAYDCLKATSLFPSAGQMAGTWGAVTVHVFLLVPGPVRVWCRHWCVCGVCASVVNTCEGFVLKSPVGQSGTAGELRGVVHRNPPLTKDTNGRSPHTTLTRVAGTPHPGVPRGRDIWTSCCSHSQGHQLTLEYSYTLTIWGVCCFVLLIPTPKVYTVGYRGFPQGLGRAMPFYSGAPVSIGRALGGLTA